METITELEIPKELENLIPAITASEKKKVPKNN
jgi:hypothetical protein